MDRRVGNGVLLLSAAGYPATRYVTRRFGRRGAAVVEVVCVGLLVRDTVMLARGTPNVLRRVPAALLRLECAAAAVAAASNARLLWDARASKRVTGRPGDPLEGIRRAAIAALFALHTVRFRIYLGPDQGRRHPVVSGEDDKSGHGCTLSAARGRRGVRAVPRPGGPALRSG